MNSALVEKAHDWLFRNSIDAIFLTVPDGRILAANPAACRMLGRSEDEICRIGRSGVLDLSDPRLAAALAERERSGQIRAELTFVRADGTRFSAEIASAIFRDGDGNARTAMIVRDVSERKRLEQEKEQYVNFFMLSTDPMCMADPFGCFKHVNPAFVQLTGYSDAELLSKPFLDFVLPEDRQRTADEMKLQVALRSSLHFENRYVCKDGSVLAFSWTAYFDKTDGVTYAIARDITEQKQAEAAQRASEEQLRAFYELDLVGLAITSPDKGWIRVNHCLCQMLGYTEPELHAMTWAQLTHPDDVAADVEQFKRLLANEIDGYSLEKRFISRTGKIVPTQLVVRCVRNANGDISYVTAMVEDITERKKADEELRKSLAFRDLLSEAMPLPVFYKDASGCYTGCNNAFSRFIGKAKSEVVGKTVFEVSPQNFAETYEDKDLDLLSGPVDMQTYESRVPHADGTVRDVIFHKARITNEAGKATGIVGVMTDITELKQIQERHDKLQEQLRQSQKMEALGTLAGGVAHDFNNIIAVIAGNVELARQDLAPAHRASESLEEIRKASLRAKALVQQILTFSRRQKALREVISLVPVVEESGRLLRATLPAGVTLTVECDSNVPPVLADATQVEQVLLNLCGNAWQATQNQKRPGIIQVQLKARDWTAGQAEDAGVAIALGDMHPGPCACLIVRDNGSGMDKATLSRIFEPFFTTKPVDKGTGLGLAVVHGIVEEHGASIQVRSIPGEGSTFLVYFPAANNFAQVLQTCTPPAEPAHGQGRHVLYVDDDESVVFLMTRLLERRGYRVSGYTDAQAALAAARADPDQFDLAVTDYNMPGISGLEVARELKRIRPDLPIALASGYITDELRQTAPAVGVSELIYKPNTAEELCEAVARLVGAHTRDQGVS